MIEKSNDMTPQTAAQALLWLAEMGADEAIGENPVDRTAAVLPRGAEAVRPALPFAENRAPTAMVASVPVPKLSPTGSDAPSLAASCESLEDLARALTGFDQCPLQRTASNLCFSDGNPRASVMLVGEAPGRDEDIEGKPFLGRSGQLLDRMLAAIGLSRKADDPDKSVFITNTIFWRPPGNRDPTETETLMCLPFLRRAIELQKPRLLVCVGKISAHRLLNTNDGILKLRGKWRSYDTGAEIVPLLATLHPAYLLRQPAQKRLAWRDLLQLRLRLDQLSAKSSVG